MILAVLLLPIICYQLWLYKLYNSSGLCPKCLKEQPAQAPQQTALNE